MRDMLNEKLCVDSLLQHFGFLSVPTVMQWKNVSFACAKLERVSVFAFRIAQ